MGCSSSPIAIDLAQQMLQLYPGTYALVLSTENITQNWYFGNNRWVGYFWCGRFLNVRMHDGDRCLPPCCIPFLGVGTVPISVFS